MSDGVTGAVVEVVLAKATTTRQAIWFYNLELALLTDESYLVSLTATTVDEDEPQLLPSDTRRVRCLYRPRARPDQKGRNWSDSVSITRPKPRDCGALNISTHTGTPTQKLTRN